MHQYKACRGFVLALLLIFSVETVSASSGSGFCARFIALFMGSPLGKQQAIEKEETNTHFAGWTRNDFDQAIKSKYRLRPDSLIILISAALKKYHNDLSELLDQKATFSPTFSWGLVYEIERILEILDNRFFNATRSKFSISSVEVSDEFNALLIQTKALLIRLEPVKPDGFDLASTKIISGDADRSSIQKLIQMGWFEYQRASAAMNHANLAFKSIEARYQALRH